MFIHNVIITLSVIIVVDISSYPAVYFGRWVQVKNDGTTPSSKFTL
ncbi:hypothetical protein VHA_001458 [Grimontia hollisae CIP 101886]|uniref:Uncharacterized protein n=1 Tax=Grimontia hollisae CIP 101886 TaxID=675812 RepID=D0I6T9_GRIHO|nr:hypothetical protein VHA_001458 [Grimontia hollisae CIP 101886]